MTKIDGTATPSYSLSTARARPAFGTKEQATIDRIGQQIAAS